MLLNFYFEVTEQEYHILFDFLKTTSIPYFDATEFDSYTYGPCAKQSLLEIEDDIVK